MIHLALPALLLLGTPACTPPTIKGHRVSDAFKDPKEQALVYAACQGFTDKVARLAKEGANVNARGLWNGTPLDWAVRGDSLPGVEALLKAGADPNLAGLSEWVPLTSAVHQNRRDLIELLLRYKADPNGVDTGDVDHRPLAKAAFEGHFDLLKHLVRAGADINVHSNDGSRSSTATKAIAMGRFDMVLWMLENGYTYDLPGLASDSVDRIVNSEGQPDKDRVLERLKAMGVPIPAPFKPKPL